MERNNLYLDPYFMIELYSKGAFPMAEDDGKIEWYLPEIRAIIPLDNFNIPRSLRKFMDKCDFEYKFDFNTIEIIENCADRESTWISDDLIKAYVGIEQLGYLHSIAVFQKGKLVGGLYGIAFRGAFFGESMFSRVPQASKAALAVLLKHLKKQGFTILDVQYMTEHLRMFGTIEIPFIEYSNFLSKAYETDCRFI